MSEWTETVAAPTVPLRSVRATVVNGDVHLRDAGEPGTSGHIASDSHWACHANWHLCWVTEERARIVGELALRHLRELEAEVRALDDLPPNAVDKAAAE